jgi:hypothetical protein
LERQVDPLQITRVGGPATQLTFVLVLFLIDVDLHANSQFRSWKVDRTAGEFIHAPSLIDPLPPAITP